MSEKEKKLEPVPQDNVLDLDAYRQKRIAEGTWPIAREEHFKFFYMWRQGKKK